MRWSLYYWCADLLDTYLSQMDYSPSPTADRETDGSQSTTPPLPDSDDAMSSVCHSLLEAIRPQLESAASRLEAYSDFQDTGEGVLKVNGTQENGHQSTTTDACRPNQLPVSSCQETTHNGTASPCSHTEFDISGQTSENRFPWLRDKSIQCNMGKHLPARVMSYTPVSDSDKASGAEATQKRTKRSQSSSAM